MACKETAGVSGDSFQYLTAIYIDFSNFVQKKRFPSWVELKNGTFNMILRIQKAILYKYL